MTDYLIGLLLVLILPATVMLHYKKKSLVASIRWVETRWFRYGYALLMFLSGIIFITLGLMRSESAWSAVEFLMGALGVWICYRVLNRKDHYFANSP